MYRYDNYTDSFIRIDGEPNTGTTTVRVGVPLKESVIVQKTELTDECVDKIADAVVRKLADRKTEPTVSKMEQVDKDINVRSKDEPQTDGILFKGNLKEGDYKLIKTTDGWVLANEDIVYCGWERSE